MRNPVFSLPHLPLRKKLPLSFQIVSCFHCLLFPSNVVCHTVEKCCPAPTIVFSLYLFHKNLVRTCQINYFSAPMYVYILKLCEGRQSRRSYEESSSSRFFSSLLPTQVSSELGKIFLKNGFIFYEVLESCNCYINC